MLHTLHTRSLLIFASVPLLRLMEQKLCTVGLSPRWVPILREKLGIRTPDGLRYVGMELYPLLLQSVKEPHEKVALLTLLKGEDSITRFLRKRKALTDSLCSFKKFQINGKNREDVSDVENHCQEMLQIPEGAWIGKDLTLSEVTCKVDGMLQSIENACEADHLNDEAFVAQVSGSLSFESIRGLPLKGIIISDEVNDFCVAEKNILRGHPDIRLQFPIRPQFFHTKGFKSKKEEVFFSQVTRFGCLMPNVKDVKPSCTCYRSTVKYWFIPQASLFLDDHHLIVSDDALSYLKEIDELISPEVENNVLEGRCKHFLEVFGSHSFQGTIHLGGIYMCLCYTLDCCEFESEDIARLQNEAIDTQLCMYFDPCYKTTRVSQIKGIPGVSKLKKLTYMQVITSGGPDKIVGFPDWKNGLFASNKLWKVIDCGLTHIAVWDIILINHRNCFQNPEKLATVLRRSWAKLFLKHIPKKFKYLNDQKPPLDCKTVDILVSERRELEKAHLDPCAWASHYVPLLEEYLYSALEKCSDVKQLKSVIEPLDIGLLDSSEELKEMIYDTCKLYPPLICNDFMKISKHFKKALSLVKREDFSKCPCAPFQGASIVEKSVNLVHKHLEKADQKHELCLLLTILLPLQYNKTSRKFSAPLTYIDIEYLNAHFDEFIKFYFEFCSQCEEHKNSYIFYLTVHISNIVEINEECVQSHVDFVQNKLQVDTNIESAREIYILFKRLGLHDKFPQVLTHRDAIQIREDTLKDDLLKSLTHKAHETTGIKSENIALEILYGKINMHCMKGHMHLHALPHKSCSVDNIREVAESEVDGYKANEYMPHVCSKLPVHSPSCTSIKTSIQAHDTIADQVTAENDVLDETKNGHLQRAKWHSFPSLIVSQSLPMASEKDCEVLPHNDGNSSIITRKYHSCQDEKTFHTTLAMPPAYIMLQKIMSFDSKCRIEFGGKVELNSEDDCDSDSEDNEDSIHPIDSLLALLHCSDNFLRQDLFCRLATCQIAVPLLLPHPITKQPTLLLWAMRSIVTEFKLNSGKLYHGQIIKYKAPFVSFLRLGDHSMSKSEILNGIINRPDSDTKTKNFFGYNFPGGKATKMLVSGLVEISWYLPGDGLYSTPIVFSNLRGSALACDVQKQINFLCDIATVHVVMLSCDTFHDDATRRDTIEILKRLSQAPGGLLILQTKEDKMYKDHIKTLFDDDQFKSKVIVQGYENNATIFAKKLQKKLRTKLSMYNTSVSLAEIAHKHNIFVDEDDTDCIKGMKLAHELCAVIQDYRMKCPSIGYKSLLPLQSEALWCKWAALDKEQYRPKKKGEDNGQQSDSLMSIMRYSEQKRKKMKEIRKEQYKEAKEQKNLMPMFLKALRIENRCVLWYYMTWLKFELDELSREILPPFNARIRKKRAELNECQKKHDKNAERKCQSELKDLDKQLIKASFGLEHLLREVGQTYEAVVEHEDINNPKCTVRDLPQIAAQLLFDGFPIELLDGDASHMPQQWITSVLNSLAEMLMQRDGCNPCIYVVSVLGIQSTGKSTLLNTVFGVQFAVSAGRCTRGAFMQLIPVHPSLYERTGVQYFLLIDTEGLRAPELDRLNKGCEHDNELATFVIGLANLTLINVAGEVAGEIDDVLTAAVHAFMRMSEVSIKSSCHIVHQHVVAVGAEEKLMQVRLTTKDKLDKMTQTAAKNEGVESKYAYFSDIIKFDHENDVSEFAMVNLQWHELVQATVKELRF